MDCIMLTGCVCGLFGVFFSGFYLSFVLRTYYVVFKMEKCTRISARSYYGDIASSIFYITATICIN